METWNDRPAPARYQKTKGTQIWPVICRVATEAGYVTRTAKGPKQVQAAYTSLNPDVVVLDILMPEMDGLEVLQFLRSQYSDACIVILSGSEELSRKITEDLGTALGFTIAANLSKPFRIAELRAVFREIGAKLAEQKIA